MVKGIDNILYKIAMANFHHLFLILGIESIEVINLSKMIEKDVLCDIDCRLINFQS